jgi:hypothetical protein
MCTIAILFCLEINIQKNINQLCYFCKLLCVRICTAGFIFRLYRVCVRFEVFVRVVMRITARGLLCFEICVFTRKYQCYGGIWCLHLQGGPRCLSCWTSLNIEEASCSETSVSVYQCTRRHAEACWCLLQRRREKFGCHQITVTCNVTTSTKLHGFTFKGIVIFL